MDVPHYGEGSLTWQLNFQLKPQDTDADVWVMMALALPSPSLGILSRVVAVLLRDNCRNLTSLREEHPDMLKPRTRHEGRLCLDLGTCCTTIHMHVRSLAPTQRARHACICTDG